MWTYQLQCNIFNTQYTAYHPHENKPDEIIFNSEPLISMPQPENAFGLSVTITFDFLTSNSNHFIFAPNCTEVVSLMKFPQAVYRANKLLHVAYDHGCTHAVSLSRTATKQYAFCV